MSEIDDALVNVLCGLIVNAITGTVAVARKMMRSRLTTTMEPALEENATRELIIPAIVRLREDFNDTDVTAITKFLRSSEAEVLFRHYLQIRSADQLVQHESVLKEQLAAYLYLCTGMDHSTSAECSTILHGLFVELADRTIAKLDSTSSLGYDIREGAWTTPTMEDMASLARTSEFLKLLTPEQVANIVRFEAIYRDQVVARHRDIVPPSWDAKIQIPIDSIYVAPKMLSEQMAADKEVSEQTIHDVAMNCHRAIVLGNPGAGKSTLITKLMHDFALDRIRYTRSAPTIPFRVVLRDYAIRKQDNGWSLLQYISSTARTEYMVDPPENAIEYFLMTGRASVLLDGLDELVMTYQRQEVARDVQTFANRYASTPMLVTSRVVGYEEAPLTDSVFERYQLMDFNDDQVEEYARKWFSLPSELSVDDRQQLATAFIGESISVSDLRANPLMLAILCNLFKGERHIPRNRVEVYRRCSVMLFERWDKDRGITISLPFASHIRYAIAYLAEWIYGNQQVQAGVPERELVAKTTEYLNGRVFDKAEDAEAAAEEFVAFCKGRAWVFTEIGGDLYQFSHRTFLEFFAALGLTRRIRDSDQFWSIFLPKLSRSEWDMVGQLALALFDEQTEGGADEILRLALDSLEILSARAESNVLQWALRSMAAVVPSPVIRRRTMLAVLNRIMSAIQTALGNDLEIPPTDLPLVAQVAEENLGAMTDVLIDGLGAELYSTDAVRASAAGTILLKLSTLADLENESKSGRHVERIWRERITAIIPIHESRLVELSRENLALALAIYHVDLINSEALVAWHGLSAAFAHLEAHFEVE